MKGGLSRPSSCSQSDFTGDEMKGYKTVLQLILLAGLSIAPLSAAFAETSAVMPETVVRQPVRYDSETDRLTVDARSESLTSVLTRISRQSGVEILVDPAVERLVTVSIKDQPLEKVIGQLTRGLNTVMVYDLRSLPGKGEQNVLVRVQLLPKGQTNTALLIPLLSPEAEAMLRADRQDTTGTRVDNLVYERRMARLEKLPAEKRARLEKLEMEKMQKERSKRAAKAEKKAARKQDKLVRLNDRLQKLQSRGGSNPERKQKKVDVLMQQIAETQAKLNGTPVP